MQAREKPRHLLRRGGNAVAETVGSHGGFSSGGRVGLLVHIHKDRLHDSAIQNLRALQRNGSEQSEQETSGVRTHAERGQLEPQDEEALEDEIPREVVENDAQREALHKVEEAEDDPVREPLDVVLVPGRLEGLDGHVRGERPADEVRDGAGEGVDRVERGHDDEAADEGVALRDLRALLEGDEQRVF